MDFSDRRNDAGICATAADVAAHTLAYLIVCEAGRVHRYIFGNVTRIAATCLFEHPDSRTYLPGRAVAALKTVVLDEGSLHRVKLFAARESFNGCDLATLERGRERQARQHPAAINEYGASAALALVATFLLA